MSFLAPVAFAFAATIPIVVVFYLLKRKRTVRLISSTLLWQRFLAETQANAPFQRLRHNWLLILQILVLLLAVFALARPYFTGTARSSRLRVLILDASASMQAKDVAPSRFESARAEALKWVDGLKDQDQMVVLVASANTEVKQSATSDKSALRRAIESTRATDSPTRLREAIQLAETLIQNQPAEANPEIHLFSDGAIPDLAEIENKNLPLVFHRIGARGQNIGLTSLDARANPDNLAQRAIFTSVVNPTTNEQVAEVELRFGEEVVETRTVTLPPTNTTPLVFIANQPRDGVFTVRLTGNDDLATDNQASIVSLLPRPAKVLLVTSGNRLLEKALRPVPGVELSTATLMPENPERFDIIVLDGITPGAWPASSVLAIHIAPTNLFANATSMESPPIVDWKNTHPLLRFVGFDTVFINETLAVAPPKWGESLVESSESKPLIVAGEIDRKRVVWVGFDTLQSTWPLRISFPIFLQNTIEWLNPASGQATERTIKAGEPLRLALDQPIDSAQVTMPDGNVKSVPLEKSAREIIFGETALQGVYKLQAGTNQITFCVNLMDAAESDIHPREEIPIGKFGAGIAATKLQRANTELWRWIALAGLCVLLFEWWWYHKRTA